MPIVDYDQMRVVELGAGDVLIRPQQDVRYNIIMFGPDSTTTVVPGVTLQFNNTASIDWLIERLKVIRRYVLDEIEDPAGANVREEEDHATSRA